MKISMFKFTMAFALTLFITMLPDLASASTGGFTGVSGAMCRITNEINGPTGRAIASLAIIMIGVGAFFGKVNWGLAILVIMGIGALFGASSIVNAIGGGDAACA